MWKEVLTAVYSYLMRGYRESGARLFSKLERGRRKDKRYKMEHRKFQLAIIKANFTEGEGGEILEQRLDKCRVSIPEYI